MLHICSYKSDAVVQTSAHGGKMHAELTTLPFKYCQILLYKLYMINKGFILALYLRLFYSIFI